MGLTVLDSGIVIGALDSSDAHRAASVDAPRTSWLKGRAAAGG